MNSENEQMSQELLDLNRLLNGVGNDVAQQMGILSGYVPTLKDAPDRIDNYCRYILALENASAKQKAKSDRLLKISKLNSIKSNSLRYMLHLYLRLWRTPRFHTECFNIDITKTDKTTVTVEISAEELPDEYVIHTCGVYPDVDKIRAALLSGIDVPGCMLGRTPYIMEIEPEAIE